MNEEHNLGIISAVGRAFFLAVIANLALVFVKESYPPFKEWMKNFTGHHWVTHGVLLILVFFLTSFLWPGKARREEILQREFVWGLAIGTLLLAGFYLTHL